MGTLAFLSSCIENDIPYPYVAGDILSVEVEGQRGDAEGQNTTAQIDRNKRTVTLFVNDSVDISELKITKLAVSPGVTLTADSASCVNFVKFPRTGFASLDSIPRSSNTRINFTKPVRFLLQTYQDYTWTISVTQIYEREIDVQDMTDYLIDVENRQVIVYLPKNQPLNRLVIRKMNLGGKYGRVIPDPVTVTDLSVPKTFTVFQNGKMNNGVMWTVRAFYQTEGSSSTSSSLFSMASRATLSGTVQSGKTPVVEYKKQNTSSWTVLAASNVVVKGTSYTATLSGLTPGTGYAYRISVDGTPVEEKTFTTTQALSLTNGSFDEWSQDSKNAKLWYPWKNGGTSFWDTGNKGATTVGDSNSTPSDDTYRGTGKAAKLESKYILVKFAAGNIFTGSYLRTEGTDGVLSFGREFNSFPTKLRVHYKYTSSTINRSNDSAYEYLKGRPDSCHIYIALTDWDEPLEIRTKASTRQLFDKNDKRVIAYAELISGTSSLTYKEVDLPLQYRYTNRTPKYMVVVASSSKYGDFFTGGEGSTLWIDDFELLYNE